MEIWHWKFVIHPPFTPSLVHKCFISREFTPSSDWGNRPNAGVFSRSFDFPAAHFHPPSHPLMKKLVAIFLLLSRGFALFAAPEEIFD
ncbi:MAG: hypothetical protein GC138_08790, partial [Gammaproteobacteria bacterium]|nr:hypothetical protein [Gammaproteobacteria bacterium]